MRMGDWTAFLGTVNFINEAQSPSSFMAGGKESPEDADLPKACCAFCCLDKRFPDYAATSASFSKR